MNFMNTLLRKAQSEMKKLKKADSIYGLETVTVTIDFTRPGRPAKFLPLTTIRVSRKTAEDLYRKRSNE